MNQEITSALLWRSKMWSIWPKKYWEGNKNLKKGGGNKINFVQEYTALTCWYLLHVGWYLFESVCISDIWTSALKHYQFSWSISFKRYGPAKLILSSSFSRHLLAQGGLDSKPNCYQFWGSISFKIYCLLAPEPCLRTISLYILKDMDQQTDIVWELRFIYLIYTLTKNISANIEKILNSIKRLDPKSCGPRKTDVNRTNGWSLWYLVHIYCNTWIVPTIPVLTEPFVVHSEIVKLYIVSVNLQMTFDFRSQCLIWSLWPCRVWKKYSEDWKLQSGISRILQTSKPSFKP